MEEVSHTFPGVPVLVVEQLLFSLRYQFFGDSHVFNILVLVEAFSHENGVVPVDFSSVVPRLEASQGPLVQALDFSRVGDESRGHRHHYYP
jgi:hypothetical protein